MNGREAPTAIRGGIGHLCVHTEESVFLCLLSNCLLLLLRLLLESLLRLCSGQNTSNDPFVLVCALDATRLAPLVHEVDRYCSVDVPLQVENVCVPMVAPGEHLARIWADLQIKLVKDSLIFVHIAKFLLQVVCHVQGLDGLVRVSDVPNVHREIVSREEIVVAGGRKLGFSNRVDNLREEVLTRGFRLEFDLHGVVRVLRGRSQVA